MRDTTLHTLTQAVEIAAEYAGNLTLRQLYYQLVARGFIENSQRSYKRVGNIVADARLRGEFPLEWLIDRGRTVYDSSSAQNDVDLAAAFANAQGAVRSFPFWYIDRGRWYGQPSQVSVWVEKEALSGVFEAPCTSQGVGWFACKGYPSISSLYDWLKRARAIEAAMPSAVEQHLVLYFGDHDPDGWQIPRSALNTMLDIIRVMDNPPQAPVRIKRVALNMDQIRDHSPPPFPAKVSSSRYARYVDEQGTTDAWELDALDPATLTALITSQVAARFDGDIYTANLAHIAGLREQFRRDLRANTERLMEGL